MIHFCQYTPYPCRDTGCPQISYKYLNTAAMDSAFLNSASGSWPIYNLAKVWWQPLPDKSGYNDFGEDWSDAPISQRRPVGQKNAIAAYSRDCGGCHTAKHKPTVVCLPLWHGNNNLEESTFAICFSRCFISASSHLFLLLALVTILSAMYHCIYVCSRSVDIYNFPQSNPRFPHSARIWNIYLPRWVESIKQP